MKKLKKAIYVGIHGNGDVLDTNICSNWLLHKIIFVFLLRNL